MPERYSQGMLEALIEGAPDLLTLIDRDRIVRFVSPAVTRVTGYDSVELLGRPFVDLLHPDDVQAAERTFNKVFTTPAVLRIRTRFRHKDGRWITLESLGRAHLNTPKCEGVLVSSRDVTHEVQLEATLRRSQRESAELFEEAPCGYHAVDADDVFLRVNRTEQRWLQRTSQELVGQRTFEDLLVTTSRKRYSESHTQLEREGMLRDAEFEILRKDGTSFPALLQSVAVRDVGNGKLIESRTTLYDVTEKKAAETALLKVNRALRIVAEARKKIIRARNESDLSRRSAGSSSNAGATASRPCGSCSTMLLRRCGSSPKPATTVAA